MSGNRFYWGGCPLGHAGTDHVPRRAAARRGRWTRSGDEGTTPPRLCRLTRPWPDEVASQPDPTDVASPSDTPDPAAEAVEPGEDPGSERVPVPHATYKRQMLLASLTIFALAMFVGFEVITKVPPTLHTPLMSGSNAISGITVVGALIVAGHGSGWFTPLLGCVAVILATINVVGGFLVTHRMLAMFKKR